jgi:hypothetical protein
MKIRIVRIIGASLLLAAAGFIGGFACIIARARFGYSEFEPDRLFSHALALTLGCPVAAWISVLMARGAGDPHGGRSAVGALACLGALALAIHGVVVLNHDPVKSVPFLVSAFALCMASSVLFAGTARTPMTQLPKVMGPP